MRNWLEQQKSPFLAQGQSHNPAYTPAGSEESLGWFEGVGKSALWGLGPGMVGVRPTGELNEWQQENPWSAFLGEASGMLVPYAGWAKATTMIPSMSRAVKAAGTLGGGAAKAPFTSAAAQEIVRFAPMEAALVAGNYFGGDTVAEWSGGTNIGAEKQTTNAAINLALGGAVAGSISKLGSSLGNRLNTKGITPSADISAPVQVQLRQVLNAVQEGKVLPEYMASTKAGINQLKSRIVREVPGKDTPYVKDSSGVDYNQLFTPKSKNISASRLDSLRDPDMADWIYNNMPDNWEAYAQFPRRLKAKDEKSDKHLTNLMKTLSEGDDKAKWAFLPEEEKFIVALNTGENGWLTFKTDKPEVFLPKSAKFSDAINRYDARRFGEEAAVVGGDTGSDLLNYGAKFDAEQPTIDTRGLVGASSKSLGGKFNKVTSKLENKSYGLGDTRYEVGAAVKGLGELKQAAGTFVKRYLSPSVFQFAENPLALRIYRTTQTMLDRGEHLAQKAILGNPLRSQNAKEQFRANALGARFKGNRSIADRIKVLEETDPTGFSNMLKAIHSQGGIEWGLENGLTREGMEILQLIKEVDTQVSDSIIAAQRAAGVADDKIFVPKENHFMLSRTWEGQYRTPVYNGNKLVYIAGGTTPKGSAQLAREVAEEGWRLGETRHTNARQDFELLEKLAANDFDYLRSMQRQAELKSKPAHSTPKTFEKRQGVEGYKTQYTGDELISALVGHTSRYRRFEAETSYDALFKKDYARLLKSDHDMAVRLRERLNAMFGIRGEIDKVVNKALDASPIGMVLGQDSASRIVQALSKYTYAVALGFTNFGYAASTLATFMQTSIPMMKYINTLAHTAPDRLHKYVSYQPVMSADGKGATILGSIDSMKIAHAAMKEMGKPGDTLLDHLYRAASEGKTDPRFLNEYVGQGSEGVKRFKDILQGKNPISGTLEAVGTFVPGTTERLSRVHSFTMGHIFYRDIMGVKNPDQLYRLAAEFTDLTQFQYGRSHKPMIFDGPVGQMLGLFKTFISNYIGWMSVYAGEGIKHNNWAPLIWQMAGTASIAGVGGLPLIGAADSIGKAFSDNDRGTLEMLRNAMGGRDDEWGNYYSNVIYTGLPALIGVSLQGTMQAPFANPVEDTLRLASSAQLDQAIKMGSGIKLGVQSLFDPNLNKTGEVSRALANGFAPRSLIKSGQALADKDLRSMNTGNTLVKDLAPMERVLWGLNLNPTEVMAAFTVFRSQMDTLEGKKATVKSLGKRASAAIQNRDSAELRSIVVEASLNGISADSLVSSARANIDISRKDMFQQQLDRQAKYRMYQLGLTDGL